MVSQATIYSALGEAIPAADTKGALLQEVVKEIEAVIEAVIDKGQNQEYAQKVARYELREAFERSVRSIQ